jgi:O-antigen/teichoic acid export membrane protein
LSERPKPRAGANAISNLAGYVLITLVTIACTPFYIRYVGNARYGMIALVWLLFSYFGIFDLGISRATTNQLAKLRDGSSAERATFFWTALFSNLALGICGALLFRLISKQLLSYYIKVPDDLVVEIDRALPWAALLIPLTIANSVFVATLEASERFFKLNVLQTIGSATYQLLTLAAVASIAPRIDVAIIAGTIGRLVTILLIAISAVQIIGVSHFARFNGQVAAKLFRYGGWVALAGIIGPFLTSIDQFVIGSMIGAQAVAYYSVSSSAASRANIIPVSLSRALFPRLSQHKLEDAKDLTMTAMAIVANTTAGLYSGAILLASPAFQLWLGEEFGSQAGPLAEILVVGMWFIGIAYFPFVMLQAQGRPDLPTKINLAETIPYFTVLWILITLYGLRGAAIAWAMRAAADTFLQFIVAGFRFGELKRFAGGFLLVIAATVIAQTTSLPVATTLVLAAICLLISAVQILRHPTLRSYAFEFLRKLRFIS